MRTEAWVGLIIMALLIAGAIWAALTFGRPSLSSTATTTAPVVTTTQEETTTPQGLTFSLPATFALATGQEPIMVHSYIPPCTEGYDYCIYKNDNEFAGTNFESAGIAIKSRTDLATQVACLNTPPAGYTHATPSSFITGASTTMSVFKNLGNAATGHSAVDQDYRLYNKSNKICLDVDTRIAQSAYANYPAGQIKEFTTADQQQVASELRSILSSMTLNGSAINWPS